MKFKEAKQKAIEEAKKSGLPFHVILLSDSIGFEYVSVYWFVKKKILLNTKVNFRNRRKLKKDFLLIKDKAYDFEIKDSISYFEARPKKAFENLEIVLINTKINRASEDLIKNI